MSVATDELLSRIKELPDDEKLRLVDAILTDLHKPASKVDRIWVEEAQKTVGQLQGGQDFDGFL
jgi:hypothetical protein